MSLYLLRCPDFSAPGVDNRIFPEDPAVPLDQLISFSFTDRPIMFSHRRSGELVRFPAFRLALCGMQIIRALQLSYLGPRWSSHRIRAPNGPASTSRIHRRRRSETIRVLSEEVPYHHLLSKLDWKADRPLTSPAFICQLSTNQCLTKAANKANKPPFPNNKYKLEAIG